MPSKIPREPHAVDASRGAKQITLRSPSRGCKTEVPSKIRRGPQGLDASRGAKQNTARSPRHECTRRRQAEYRAYSNPWMHGGYQANYRRVAGTVRRQAEYRGYSNPWMHGGYQANYRRVAGTVRCQAEYQQPQGVNKGSRIPCANSFTAQCVVATVGITTAAATVALASSFRLSVFSPVSASPLFFLPSTFTSTYSLTSCTFPPGPV